MTLSFFITVIPDHDKPQPPGCLLDTAKNGYILLVQDAEPNFDVNGNSPVIPGDVLSAILKVARVRADFDDFDGDRRGIGDCLDEAEQELIVTIKNMPVSWQQDR